LREEIQAVLISNGTDPKEARDRIDNLSDDEIGKFVHEIDQLPAGGGGSVGVVTLFYNMYHTFVNRHLF